MSKTIFREKWELWWKIKDMMWSENSPQQLESLNHPRDTPVMFMGLLYDIHVQPNLINLQEVGA